MYSQISFNINNETSKNSFNRQIFKKNILPLFNCAAFIWMLEDRADISLNHKFSNYNFCHRLVSLHWKSQKKHCLHILAYLPHAGVWECIINYCLQTPNIWCGRNAQCMLHKVHSPQLHAASGSSTTSLQHQHQLWSLRKHTGTNFNQTMPPDFSSS